MSPASPCQRQSRTRSGVAYSPPLSRTILCSSFSLSQCLEEALSAEDCSVPEFSQTFGPKRPRSPVHCPPAPPSIPFAADRPFMLPLLPSAAPSPANPVLLVPPLVHYHYDSHAERDRVRKITKRVQLRDAQFLHNTKPVRPEVVRRHVHPDRSVPVEVNISDLPTNSSGYEALAKDSSTRALQKLAALLVEGYRLIEWDGKDTLLLVDRDTGKIFATLVGRPDCSSYLISCADAADYMLKTGREEVFTAAELSHKRGDNFPAINTGILAGRGPPAPYNLRCGAHQAAAQALVKHDSIQRLALYQDAAFKLYYPKLYDYYHHHTVPLRQRLPYLKPNWDRSIFSAAAFNLGPQVVTNLHRDCMNLAFGMCAIHALGQYDHTKGGHLVLKEPKLVIQFPPGALVLIPSATITHGNVPIQDGETRLSFTQYSSGAMFRYVDNGFRTVEDLRSMDKQGYEAVMNERPNRWRKGLELWSTPEELLQQAKEEGELSE